MRFFYRYEKGSTTFLHSFRPEYRTFFGPDGEPWTQPIQIRLRLKLQANIALNEEKSNLFILANEWLFADAPFRAQPCHGNLPRGNDPRDRPPANRRGVAGSPDGLHWKLINSWASEAIVDGATHWMFDPASENYVLYGRTAREVPELKAAWSTNVGFKEWYSGRAVGRIESSDSALMAPSPRSQVQASQAWRATVESPLRPIS